jgi:hypothetical protein
MAMIFIEMSDLPFLSIMSVKMDEVAGEVEVIMWHEKHKLPLFIAEMIFLDKRDGKWIGQASFFAPDDVHLNSLLKRKLKFYLIEIFGSIFDEQWTVVDPLAALDEETERNLAYMSM